MNYKFNHSQQKFLFLLGVTVIYLTLVVWLDFLQGPQLWDEITYWGTSLSFSDRLLPTIDSLRDYNELSTPLPFIIFGALEYLFDQGIWLGRLLNLLLSLSMVFIIGWPSRHRRGTAILCVIGLFVCPYYLFVSGRLYTEIIACFWGLLGIVGYVHNRHWLSCVAFVLAIASRQYMVAFPLAIATYELIPAAVEFVRTRQFTFKAQLRWIAPLIATLSIFGWIYLFAGLAPKSAYVVRAVPAVQQTTWALTPGVAINFLTAVAAYIVIPEFLLFRPNLGEIKKNRWLIALIAVGLLLLFFWMPPVTWSKGLLSKATNLLPSDGLKMVSLYGLSLLTCLRFCKPRLLTLLVLFNSLIMIKAHPWDKYVLPLVVVFWYLKSIGFEEKFNTLPTFGKSRNELDMAKILQCSEKSNQKFQHSYQLFQGASCFRLSKEAFRICNRTEE
ncbi:MAG: hypothetical protein WA885_20400 [Phormidesmis sp.]